MYIAGFVDWTSAELDRISKMWTRAYKQAWKISNSTDSSPFILGQPDGGRGCPLASTMWTRESLEVIEQCVSLPGETSQIVLPPTAMYFARLRNSQPTSASHPYQWQSELRSRATPLEA